jgi:hypothetical protein
VSTPPGFADISMQFTLAGFPRPAYVTFGAQPTSTNPSTIAGAVSAAAGVALGLMTIIDTSVVLSGVRVSLGTDGGDDIIGFTTTNVPGTQAGSSHPPNVATLVHKRTARGGRRGRGRWFLPWCRGESDTDEAGLWTPSSLTTMQNACNNFLAELSVRNMPMVLLHSPQDPANENSTAPGVPTPVIALEVDPLVSTQRRRLGR